MSNLSNKEKALDFFNTYIKSPDTIVSFSLSIVLYLALPATIKSSFALSFYNIGITVLSIIFSLFFAALAIIMSSTDSEFIVYLEKDKMFSGLMETFKVVLLVLFISLVYSIILFLTTDFYIKEHTDLARQNKNCFIIFQFLFTYSLIATALTIKDTIYFTSHRTAFLIHKENEKNKS